MSYIGSQPATNFETVRKQVSTTNSGTTITLDYSVSSVQDILVTVNAVVQSYDNYSVSGTTLTLGGTLNNDRVEILYVGRTFQTVSPAVGTVTNDMLVNSSITLNGSAVSLGGSFDLNTPNFHATSSSTSIADNTAVTVINGSESWDTDNLYDTSTGKFTVTASTTGYYYFYASIGFAVLTANRIQIGLRYNDGSDTELLTNETQTTTSGYPAPFIGGVIHLPTSGHYVFVKGYQNSGGAISLSGEINKNFFGGFKIA